MKKVVLTAAVAAGWAVLCFGADGIDLSKPYTMVNEAGKYIAEGKTPPPGFLFNAALAADWTGDGVKSRDILAYMLSKDSSNSPEVKRALVRLCTSGGDVAYYRRYLASFPHDLDALKLGLEQLHSFVNNGKTRDYAEILSMLLENWPKGEGFQEICRSMFWAVHDTNVLGVNDGKQTVKVLCRAKGYEMTTWLSAFLERYCQRNLDVHSLYDLYIAHKDVKWPKFFLDRIAGDGATPEKTTLEIARRIAQTWGIDPARPHDYINRWNWRFQKELKAEWEAFRKECAEKKFPDKSSYPDFFAFQNKFQWWNNEYRNKKWDGKPEEALKAAQEVFKTGGTARDCTDFHGFRWFVEGCSRVACENPNAAANYPFEGMAKSCFERIFHDTDVWYYRWVLGAYEAAGKLKEGLDRVMQAVNAAGTAESMASWRFSAAIMAEHWKGNWRMYVSDVGYNWDTKVFSRAEPALDRAEWFKRFAQRFGKATVPERIYVPDFTGWNNDVRWRCEQGAREAKREMTEAEKKYIKDTNELLALASPALYANGFRRNSGPWGVQLPTEWRFMSAIDRGANDPLLAEMAAAMIKTGREGDWRDMGPRLRTLVASGKVEIAYMVMNRRGDRDKNSELQKLRIETAGKLTGLYPVSEKDPEYPLYVAADAFAKNNPERAWTLLSENMRVFDKDPLRYQPQFALWALEQYRKVRGENNALRDKAWEHVEKLLQNESTLPAEVAAGLFLLRAEISEDRMQYDVAHTGYQTLRNHKEYQKTAAGRQAMFKDVDLMIVMGSMDGAAQVAEAWLATTDEQVRAQAHYVLAKIAFLRKDYEETRKELDKVFEIDFTHAEARLLQGEWKLATNYEVDDTQVLVGDLADRSAIRPGQPLSISVQDKNLSVAGGGASIPVVVTTSAGKDREKVLLYPGTRDPSLFRGSIETELGVAKPGNSVLQLAGDDTVSYQIDPEFLAARGLKSDKVKRLRVVDDAELRLGAGKEIVNLKPGLPLYVALTDRDRSRSTGATSVEVSIQTSSGDRLPKQKLVEDGPCAGVFRAEVKTAIPPPRAFASDSTSGKGPEDLISSKRDGRWQSLSDGKKPKFVGVDTMASYEVKHASVEMGSPEAVARLKLWGTLFGEEMLLGSYPSEDGSDRTGITLVQAESSTRNRTDFMRELSRKAVKPVKVARFGVERKDDRRYWVRQIVRGMIYVDRPRTITLRCRPLAAAGAQDVLRWLGMDIYLDGVRMGGDQDGRLNQRTFEVFFDEGVHELELYCWNHTKNDSFELCEVKDDGELVSLPADWTDPEKWPQLKAVLEEKCKILRGKTGFSAEFKEPERLRKLRWEFVDFTGNQLSVDKLRIVDKDDATVIPGEHDFTEALGNDILEVAPGDTITVTYEDDITSSGRHRAVEKKIGSSFHDGVISFLFEEIGQDEKGNSRVELFDAYRVAPGDTIYVRVYDPDLDVSKDVDSVKVAVQTTGGTKMAVRASERTVTDANGEEVVREPGAFYAQIRTMAPPANKDEPIPDGTLVLKEGEGILAVYKDEDNTHPGVPVPRKMTLSAVPKTKTKMRIANTWSVRGVDRSPEAEVKLKAIRRRSESAKATVVWRTSFAGKFAEPGEIAIVTPQTVVPVELVCPSLIRHSGSTARMLVATKSEIDAAAQEGRDIAWQKRPLTLRGGFGNVKMATEEQAPVSTKKKRSLPTVLRGNVELYSSIMEERAAGADDGSGYSEDKIAPIDLKPDDELVVRFVNDDGEMVDECRAKIGTTGWIGLADSTYEAENAVVHLGETFHLMVIDPDRDTTDEQDTVEVDVVAKSGGKRTLKLTETMSRSGVFTGPLTPSIITPETNAVAQTEANTNRTVSASAFPSAYGDRIGFRYDDADVSFAATSGVRKVVGDVLPGSDGDVRTYSKRFRDSDQAVLVQFRLAECLFEMAKDFRKLKNPEKSAAAIDDGKKILEAALKDYPNTKHAAEGEFLLANLYEQLAEEERQARAQREKDGEDLTNEPNKADPLYREAVARFSAILSAWPDGDYAARSQYHKALCLERLGDYARASEEYVKMTYLFPESPLVGDASVRLASYYYQKEKRYDIAGKIYTSFRNRFPAHPQAPNALFMGGQCLVKQAETISEGEKPNYNLINDAYEDAVKSFVSLVENYKDIQNKELLAQGLYWAGDISFRLKDYPNAYIYLKRTTFEYPESKWARYARGMLLQESKAFEEVAE